MKISKLIASGIFAFAMITGSANAQTKIVFASPFNPSQQTTPALQELFAEINKETNGSVVWEPHWGSSLLAAKDIPTGVRDGISDAGSMVSAYVPSEMPIMSFVGNISMLNDDPLVLNGVVNELVQFHCEQCTDEYNKLESLSLVNLAASEYYFQCKEPLKEMSDMAGKKIRGFSGWSDLIKEMNAVPVTVPYSETYEALSRGTIDCSLNTIGDQRALSLGEVAENIIMAPLGGYTGTSMLAIRKEMWGKLSAEEKGIVLKNLPRALAGMIFAYLDVDAEVREEMEAKGNSFYEPNEDLMNYIEDFRLDYVKNRSVEIGRGDGIENPDEIISTSVNLYDKWKKLLEENGRDRATYEKLLWDEIYSKVPAN